MAASEADNVGDLDRVLTTEEKGKTCQNTDLCPNEKSWWNQSNASCDIVVVLIIRNRGLTVVLLPEPSAIWKVTWRGTVRYRH